MGDQNRLPEHRSGRGPGGWIHQDPQGMLLLFAIIALVGYQFVTTGGLAYYIALAKARLLERTPYLVGAGIVLALCGLLALSARAAGRRKRRDPHALVLGRAKSGPFAVRPEERATHLTVVGLSGTGKSKALASWVSQDIQRRDETTIALDIHQTLIEDILGQVGDSIDEQRGLILEAGHPRWVYGFDPLWCFPGDRPELRAVAAAQVWRTVYGDSWSDRIEYYLRSVFQALIESGWTILEAPRLLDDQDFRRYVQEHCRSDALRDFFRTYEAKRQGRQAEEIASVQVRLQEFTSDPLLRAMLGPAVRDAAYLRYRRAALPGYEPRILDLATLIEEGRPILADLPYRELGENSRLLAGTLLAVLLDIFLRRDATLAGSGLRQANLWADELQHYATDAVATIFTQTRKFRLSFCAACTSLGQLPPALQETLLGAGLLLSFQVLTRDARALAPEMFRREFDRVKQHADGPYASRAPIYYHESEVLAAQTDWLNKTGARQFWAYSRRRRQDAVLLRTLDVRHRLSPQERETVREGSGGRYGNPLDQAEAELRLRYRWLEERRYALKPRTRQQGRDETGGAPNAADRAPPAVAPPPDAAPPDPFA